MKATTERRTVRRRIATAAGALVATGALLFGLAAPASATVYPGGYLVPVSAQGTALDIWDANSSVGAWVGTYKVNPGWNQRFDRISVNGGIQIRSQNGQCLRVGSYQPSIGMTPIVTANCNANDNAQVWVQWVVSPGGATLPGLRYQNKASGNCLDATNKTWAVDWPCHTGDNQRWTFTGIDWR